MPERTNEFQEIASLIEQALAPKGAKVTTSAMVDVPGLEPTEVDVLIEGDFGPYRMKVAVEAKDEKRPLNIIAFRSYLAKYRGECRAQVDRFVLITRKGFTKQVQKAAAKADVDLLTLTEAKRPGFWAKQGPTTLRLSQRVHVCKIFTEPETGLDSKTLKERGRLLCKCHGHDKYGLLEFANRAVFNNCLPKHPEVLEQLQQAARDSETGNGWYKLYWPMEEFLLSVDGTAHLLEKVIVHLHMKQGSGQFERRTFARCTADGNQQLFDHFQTTIAGKPYEMLMQSGPSPDRIILRIGSAEDRKKLRDQRNKEQKKKAKLKGKQ